MDKLLSREEAWASLVEATRRSLLGLPPQPRRGGVAPAEEVARQTARLRRLIAAHMGQRMAEAAHRLAGRNLGAGELETAWRRAFDEAADELVAILEAAGPGETEH